MADANNTILLALPGTEEAGHLADRLREAGHEVLIAQDEAAILDAAAASPVDLAVVDIDLPGISGLGLCRRIQAAAASYVSLLMLRSRADREDGGVLECFEAGADDCLVKPYAVAELLARISRFLRSSRQEARLREQQSLLEKRVETQYYEIRRLRDLNREIVTAIPSMLVVLDEDQKVLYANPSFCEKLGVEESALRENHITDVLGESFTRKDELLGKIRHVIEEGGVDSLQDMLFDAGPGRRRMFFNAFINPISGEVTREVLLVFNDVTETARRRDVLAMLRNIAQSIHGTLDLDRVLFTILTCATAGVAIGFSRAFLFLINGERQTLDGEMAVGPTSLQDAIQVWSELSKEQRTLDDLLAAYDKIPDRESMPLREFIRSARFPLRESREIPVLAIRERRTYLVTNAPTNDSVSDAFLEKFKFDSFVVVPMIARNRVVGAVLADNAYSGRPITRDQVELLEAFVGQAALAVDSAESYRSLQDKVQKLAKAYEDLRTAKERVIRAEQLATIGDMAARVAHEIRNPLVTIGGFARAINRAPDKTSRVKSNSWIIVQEVERLERILSNIMNFARPPSPMFERHNINRLIDDTLDMLREEIERQGITAERRLDESIPLVMIDGQQVKQVLLNLMQNSISALEGGGKLTVATRNEGHYFEIHISDTGRGIPEDLRDKIFTPFFTTKAAGTGLGLPIVKKIVDDHDGAITFRSDVGEGTTFVLRFPVSPMRRDAGPDFPELPPERQSDR